ncbi:MAG TPA: Mut7-C RNAse domain-containing protein [Verrucomicrobiae bacterium]|nr:Mut7-C RNAse domain-containing protein [Verrucomicrobiae bacterium]
MKIRVRFHGCLNDFLRPASRNHWLELDVRGIPALLDTLQALGVPQAEIGRVTLDGRAARLSRRAGSGKVEAWPADFGARRSARFALDVPLGKLARHLRLLGFDAAYRNDYDDAALVEKARRERRLVLTRDVGLLKRRRARGFWLRNDAPALQLKEVLARMPGLRPRPFRLCLACNGRLRRVSKAAVLDRLLPNTRRHFNRFFQCCQCCRIYWPGSHYKKMRVFLNQSWMKRPS